MAETTVRRIGTRGDVGILCADYAPNHLATRVGGDRNHGDRRTRLAEFDCDLRVCRGELFLSAQPAVGRHAGIAIGARNRRNQSETTLFAAPLSANQNCRRTVSCPFCSSCKRSELKPSKRPVAATIFVRSRARLLNLAMNFNFSELPARFRLRAIPANIRHALVSGAARRAHPTIR